MPLLAACLPATGTDLGLAGVAIALIASGAAAVAVARRHGASAALSIALVGALALGALVVGDASSASAAVDCSTSSTIPTSGAENPMTSSTAASPTSGAPTTSPANTISPSTSSPTTSSTVAPSTTTTSPTTTPPSSTTSTSTSTTSTTTSTVPLGSVIPGGTYYSRTENEGQIQASLDPAPGPTLNASQISFDDPSMYVTYIYYFIGTEQFQFGFSSTGVAPTSVTATISIPGYAPQQVSVNDYCRSALSRVARPIIMAC